MAGIAVCGQDVTVCITLSKQGINLGHDTREKGGPSEANHKNVCFPAKYEGQWTL